MSKFSIIRRQILILLLISIVIVITTACASRQAKKTSKVEEPQAPVNSDSDITANIEEKDTNLLDENNTQNEDEPEKSELDMHTDVKTFREVEGKTLTLSVDLPSIWRLTSPEEELPDQYYIEDETGTKLGGTYGILKVIQDNENLNNLKNPAGYLSPIESSEIITIGNREYLLETTNLSSKQRENLIAYSYCFIQDGALIQFYFFNDGDKKDKIVIYEEILQSIKVTIN